RHDAWAREFFHAATYTFIGGAVVSVFAALTGLFDAWRSSEAGTQARRTINAHATIMLTVRTGVDRHCATPLDLPHEGVPVRARAGDLDRDRSARLLRRPLWRVARLRIRVQRRDRGRLPRVAQERSRRVPRREVE